MKIEYLKDLAQKIEDGKLKMKSLSKMTDDEIIEHLTQVKGIGRWTAEMFLIFSLGRLDVLLLVSGLRKGVQMAFFHVGTTKTKRGREIGDEVEALSKYSYLYVEKPTKNLIDLEKSGGKILLS